ncbi:hypothetical protein ACGF3K_01885 [Streptomyces sp. NPDC047980]|uniref:hypothetical protein n=1 Tax=Streptomyces sp. NPDC047980 TaxID=3365494 RepID=UPI00371D6D29
MRPVAVRAPRGGPPRSGAVPPAPCPPDGPAVDAHRHAGKSTDALLAGLSVVLSVSVSVPGASAAGPRGCAAGAPAVAAGDNHSPALMGDGTVRAWGSNSLGRLGNGTVADSAVPVQVAGIPGCRGHGEPVHSPGGRDHDDLRGALKQGAAPVR